MKLLKPQLALLQRLVWGWTLQRWDRRGTKKVFRIKPPKGYSRSVSADTVAALVKGGLVDGKTFKLVSELTAHAAIDRKGVSK